jgi:ribosomal protein S1
MIDTMKRPLETFEMGQEIQAKVAFDAEREEVAAFKPISSFEVGDEVLAKVTNIIGAFGAFCSIGASEDALLRREDLSGNPPKDIHDVLAVGDLVPVIVKKVDITRGQIHLTSRSKKKKENQVIKRLEVGEEVTAKVRSIEADVGATLDVESDGDGFMHISDISDEAPEDISDVFKVGDIIQARVKTFNPQTGHVALTNRQEKTPFSNVERGQDVMCRVVAKAPWGVFCDIGTDGNALLHVGDMDDPPKSISAAFKIGDTFQARIRRIDPLKQRILLTTRTNMKHWSEFEEGQEVTGKVTNVIDWYVFVEIGCDEDAMMRKEDIDIEPGRDLREKFRVGDTVTATVKTYNAERGRLLLASKPVVARKAAVQSLDSFEVGQEVTAKVLRIAGSFGAFCDIGCAHDAFLHVSDLTDEPFADIGDLLAVGDTFDAKVKKMNPARKQIHIQSRDSQNYVKRLEDFEVGQEVKARVLSMGMSGVFCDVGADRDALLHESDRSEATRDTKYHYNDIIEARVKKIDLVKRRFYITTKTYEDFKGGRLSPSIQSTDEFKAKATATDLKNAQEAKAKQKAKAKLAFENLKNAQEVIVKTTDNNLESRQEIAAKVPSNDFKNGQKVKAKVSVNDLTDRQEVTAKLPSKLEIGQEVQAKVLSTIDAFGAYVEFAPGENALMRMSDLFDEPPEDINDVLKVGDTLVATVKRAEWPPLLQVSSDQKMKRRSKAYA